MRKSGVMETGLKRLAVLGTTLKVRVEVVHSADCSELRSSGDPTWVEDGHRYRDKLGGKRSDSRRWMLFRCNGVSSAEHGDERHFCKARVIVEPFALSEVINKVLCAK